MKNPIAVLDRRVRVIEGSRPQRSSIGRVSELRSLPFVVLLGEPGSGKSTVLQVEAAHEHTSVLTVRALMSGAPLEPGSPLYLDALDEYRIDGSSLDKVHGLGQLMRQIRASRWRLTCRAEDWRKEADLAAVSATTSGEPIVVAQLLPLASDEAALLLESLGERDAHCFLTRAYALGAHGLLESPLSLKLLHKAVSDGGEWPSNRHALFAAAIHRLAHEYNPEHKGGPRCPVPHIIEAAEMACLVLLLSGSRAIWRSHDEPPSAGADARAFLRAHDLSLDGALVKDMLDSSLFRGEGEEFEPMHRTVAEYLAGRALARAVRGSADRAAFPLLRAIAMITSADRVPPTEMRGVYAWFAAHLATLGEEDGARQLIESDAATVLMYGDAAVFCTPLRRAILNHLDRADPYFRAFDIAGDTAVGGLSGPDLTEDFADILEMPSDGTHRLLTVFEVLLSGPPIEALRPRLWRIAVDPARPEWQRRRAADAWLNGAQGSARELWDALTAEAASTDREALRVHLATLLPAGTLSVPDIKSLITDFERMPEDHTVGRLMGITYVLATPPPGELFDEPLDSWLPKEGQRHHSVELDYFFDALLAASIRGTLQLTALRLWRWTCNVRAGDWAHLHDESAKALRSWLDGEPSREAALLDAIIADQDTGQTPWMPGNNFTAVSGREPSASSIRHVLGRAARANTQSEGKWFLSIAVEMARRLPDDEIYSETLDRISGRPEYEDLVERLTLARVAVPSETVEEAQAARRERDAQQKAKNVQLLTPELEDLRVGRRPGYLAWAAQEYFLRTDAQRPAGVERIIYFTDEVISEAILAGWRHIVTREVVGVDAQLLGQAVGKNETYGVEWAVLAGLDQLLAREPLPDISTIPIVVAIAILKSSWMLQDAAKRKQFERWALHRLNVDPAGGAAQLLQFWCAAVDADATHLESLGRLGEYDSARGAVADALDALLHARRSMPAALLRSALRDAAKLLDSKRLLACAEAALADTAIVNEPRLIWSFVAFALDPRAHAAAILSEHGPDGGARLSDELRGHYMGAVGAFAAIGPAVRAERGAVIVRLVGPSQSPDEDERTRRGEGTSELVNVVRGAIQALASDADVGAGRALGALLQEPSLAPWRRSLQHAHALWSRLHREGSFRYPTPAAIRAALAGGPPVNAADLGAVVVGELYRLRRELRTSDNTPWKRYWNVDSNGSAVQPLIENQCRDHLLDRLRDRLARYNVTAALPEARRSEETRADMLILSGSGTSLPIEAKRHHHRDLWVAPSTQLQGYADAEGSEGHGIYLVFWFGLDVGPTPGRADGAAGPNTAEELEAMLAVDLSSAVRERINVIVFDVSRTVDAKVKTASS
jgi:hypothetical protein